MFASGASPGLKALTLLLRSAQRAPKSPSGAELSEVGDAFLTIKPEQPRAEASVRTRLLSFENTAKLNSQLEAESAAAACAKSPLATRSPRGAPPRRVSASPRRQTQTQRSSPPPLST